MKKTLIAVVVVAVVVLLWWGFYGNGVELADGKHLGFVHFVGGSSIEFDDAVWLSGKEGEDAAIEAGYCTEETRSECLPNNFFIQNSDMADEKVSVDDSVKVVMQTWKMEETGEVTSREIPFDDFAALINDSSLHWNKLPYDITVKDGKITLIEEIYIP